MSLTDKVIKNTVYYILSQIIGFVFPLFLTPFIIAKIGSIEFGIYALVLGFTGTIGLFDLSISNSFIKFISEYYNKKQFKELNEVVNTGLFFYIIFALVFCIIGFLSAEPLLGLLNIPANLFQISIFAFKISLVIFFITTAFGIYNSILISLQKMYLTSILGTVFSLLNFIAIIILLSSGFGMIGLLLSQLTATFLSIALSFIIAKRELPQMELGLKYFSKASLKKMTNFGLQMQVSKLASFASDKYDEFLLGFFSVMNNVTYFNVGGRISRIGRFLPYQLVPQVAPVAAELSANDQKEKLSQLFEDTTKYLTILSAPIFIYIFFFADVIILTWMGPGFEISAYILRILVIGQVVNMTLSAPGNSITPNIGIPKFQMYEGIINLSINLVLSFIFIKYYGIIGAAIGSTASIVISSVYVFVASSKYFNLNIYGILKDKYSKPCLVAFIGSIVIFLIYILLSNSFMPATDRISGAIYLATSSLAFLLIYTVWIFNYNYLNLRDKEVLVKILLKFIPLKLIIERKNKQFISSPTYRRGYENELVSLFLITYNRVEFLKKCICALEPTLADINYELIIWDNNSGDGTREYLQNLQFGNVKIVLNEKNIGTNAKGKAADLCRGDFLIGIDDDVIEFPTNWIQQMIFAYKNIPSIGYLASDVIQDGFTDGAKPDEKFYFTVKYYNDKIELQIGPSGGWCFIISKDVYKKVGKFTQPEGRIFFGEDNDYTKRVFEKGLKFGILKGLKVYHATGDYYNKPYKQIFDQKMKDLFETNPHQKTNWQRFRTAFRVKYFYYKLLEYAERELSRN